MPLFRSLFLAPSDDVQVLLPYIGSMTVIKETNNHNTTMAMVVVVMMMIIIIIIIIITGSMIADRLHDRRTHPPRRYFSDLIFEEIITDILHSSKKTQKYTPNNNNNNNNPKTNNPSVVQYENKNVNGDAARFIGVSNRPMRCRFVIKSPSISQWRLIKIAPSLSYALIKCDE